MVGICPDVDDSSLTCTIVDGELRHDREPTTHQNEIFFKLPDILYKLSTTSRVHLRGFPEFYKHFWFFFGWLKMPFSMWFVIVMPKNRPRGKKNPTLIHQTNSPAFRLHGLGLIPGESPSPTSLIFPSPPRQTTHHEQYSTASLVTLRISPSSSMTQILISAVYADPIMPIVAWPADCQPVPENVPLDNAINIPRTPAPPDIPRNLQ